MKPTNGDLSGMWRELEAKLLDPEVLGLLGGEQSAILQKTILNLRDKIQVITGFVSALVVLKSPELSACLEQLIEDFERGIVRIEEKGTVESFRAALKEDGTAGQNWETIEARLLANNAELLRKAAAMPGGARLIGVHPDGTLAIRQRSQEIVNARWTNDWDDGQSDKGELLLLAHAVAIARPSGRWASVGEIVQAVKAAGYHVPADSPNHEKEGLVAASEVVTGEPYVMSPDGKEWRSAMLECDENVPDSSYVRVVSFYPDRQKAFVGDISASNRYGDRGAVLWLRG